MEKEMLECTSYELEEVYPKLVTDPSVFKQSNHSLPFTNNSFQGQVLKENDEVIVGPSKS
ncbi:hypothetical protein SDJN02_15360, partial [Cucurbita argyrosperma subsp. argyrosperma]